MLLDNMKQTQTNTIIETPFVGTQNCQVNFSTKDNQTTKLTRKQARLVKEAIDNHMNDKSIVITRYDIAIYPKFVSVMLSYFPKEAHNTVWTTTNKHCMIGKNGGIRFLECGSSMNKNENMIPKFRNIAIDYFVGVN